MKIAFALAVHSPDDDRVWEQQAQTLLANGHEVFIISATDRPLNRDGVFCFEREISCLKQINNFCYYLSIIRPDTVICDNPVSILGAKRYKKKAKKTKIYYDITEWYPSKIHLRHKSKIKNILKFPLLCGISFYVSCLVSGFIFGEYYKARPYKLFFWKKYIELTYYADFGQIKMLPIKDNFQQIVLSFAGKLNEDSGFDALSKAVALCAKRVPYIDFVLRVITKDTDKAKTEKQANLTKEYLPQRSFKEFCEEIGKADIFFDLRKMDWENSHSLPIKLFYYMACGRPVIYSDLKAIRKGVPEINEFGFLVNPKDTNEITEKIFYYIENRKLYQKHCARAGELVVTKYNWQNIENRFIEFIEK